MAENWGNFCINIVDVIAAAKTVNLDILLKNYLPRVGNNECGCLICMDSDNYDDLEVLHENTVQGIQSLLDCDENILKYKSSYVAGHLVHKYGYTLHNIERSEDILTEYLTELNRGGLHVSTLSTVFFVHSAYQAHSKISLKKQRCRHSQAFV